MEKNISAAEAKKLDEIEKKLIKEFKEQIKIEDNYEKIKQKTFEPITSAIGKVESKIGEVLNENKNLMELVPVVNQFANVSISESEGDFELPKLPSSTPFRPRIIEESTMVDPISPTTSNIIIGEIGKKFLPRAKDDKFGFYWDEKTKFYDW